MTDIYYKPTADRSSERDKVTLNIREHTWHTGRAVVELYNNESEQTYFAADRDDRPRLALAMLGERTDNRIGFLNVEECADDSRVDDDDLAFFAYRSLAALQLRKTRREAAETEAAEAQARVDEEREAGIAALTEATQGAGVLLASSSAVRLYDAGVRAA